MALYRNWVSAVKRPSVEGSLSLGASPAIRLWAGIPVRTSRKAAPRQIGCRVLLAGSPSSLRSPLPTFGQMSSWVTFSLETWSLVLDNSVRSKRRFGRVAA